MLAQAQRDLTPEQVSVEGTRHGDCPQDRALAEHPPIWSLQAAERLRSLPEVHYKQRRRDGEGCGV